MRRVTAVVRMSPLTIQDGSFPPWEIPILQMIHGQVEILGESRDSHRVPDPRDEYVRLMGRFGLNKETLIPRVQELYGAGEVGVQALTTAMRQDLEEQAEFDRAEAEAAAATGTDGPQPKEGKRRARE